MKLTDLDATFVKISGNGHYQLGNLITEAQGIIFKCPLCHDHQILVWFRDKEVPNDLKPGPGRWLASGTGLDDLTLNPSIDLSRNETGCKWHGWVKQGDAK